MTGEPDPIDLSNICDALDEMTDDETTGVIIITMTKHDMQARVFGDPKEAHRAAKATSEALLPN
jgi:hypothetical protein